MSNLKPGEIYLLDGKKKVVIVKPHNRLLTKYVVEIPGQSVELVEQERLTPILQLQESNS